MDVFQAEVGYHRAHRGGGDLRVRLGEGDGSGHEERECLRHATFLGRMMYVVKVTTEPERGENQGLERSYQKLGQEECEFPAPTERESSFTAKEVPALARRFRENSKIVVDLAWFRSTCW
jgi:hypothetical protein